MRRGRGGPGARRARRSSAAPAAADDPAVRRPARPAAGACSGTGRRSATLPAGPVRWRRAPAYPHQAFRVGDAAWGVQGHPEVTAEIAAAWAREDSPLLVAAGRAARTTWSLRCARPRPSSPPPGGRSPRRSPARRAATSRRPGAGRRIDSVSAVTGRPWQAARRARLARARLHRARPARPQLLEAPRSGRSLDDERRARGPRGRPPTRTPRCAAWRGCSTRTPATPSRSGHALRHRRRACGTGCSRCSARARRSATTWCATPSTGELLVGRRRRGRRRVGCGRWMLAAVGADPTSPRRRGRRPRSAASRRAARRLPAARCSSSPRATSPDGAEVADVAAELADLAGGDPGGGARRRPGRAAGDRGRDVPARRDRDGQVRRPRAQLRQRRRRRLRRRGGRRRRDEADGARRRRRALAVDDDAGLLGDHRRGHDLAGRRGAAPGGQGRPAGAHAGQPRRLLRAVGQDVGVPGAAQGPAGRRRPGARAGVRRGVAPLVWQAADRAGLRRRRAADAPPGRGDAARRGEPPRAQARPGRPAGRGVRRAAAAARARPHRRHRCAAPTRWRRWRRCRRTATSGATTPPSSTAPTASCAPSSTGCSCTGCGAPT